LGTSKGKSLLSVPEKLLIDVIALSIISILCLLFLPIASYTYKKTKYTLNGLKFITGTTIQQGSIQVTPSWLIIAVIIALFLTILIAVVFPKFKRLRTGCVLLLITGMVQIGCIIIFNMQLENMLDPAKKVESMYGITISIIQGVLLVIRTLHILYVNKIITILDFMVLPGCIYFLINNYFPLTGLFLAFKKIDFTKGLLGSDWVGLDNFKYLFTTKDAFIITRNTILYNVVFIILGTVLGITVGIFLSEVFSKKLKKLYQTSILLPQLISIIIIAYIVYAFLSNEAGLINKSILGEGNEINFYNTKIFWPFILIIVNTWKGLGYNSIIYLSAIVGIDRTLYEAAYVDGASRLKQIIHITIPLLKPTIVTLTLMSVGRIFYSDFGLFYQVPMDSGTLYAVTQTIDTYVYRSLLQINNISMASAASAYQSIVGFIIVIVANGIVRKFDKENAMF